MTKPGDATARLAKRQERADELYKVLEFAYGEPVPEYVREVVQRTFVEVGRRR